MGTRPIQLFGTWECEAAPKVVDAFTNVKDVHVATGDYTTFVVSEDGDGSFIHLGLETKDS
ncbi:putative E3 ubiquitin-protein ligase HERC1-like protein [Trifolium pratense]|uniref:Putative E3 ubiquitin-protein ligase HERC1-like protein n=1 Tax=Trifolium pratense TaxID=57577 RepID=A0A2K3KZL1_TRIPR|nr:putative E3 ubiquitin-protein ligase HERC1-like protein [Trifolium pratense]